MEIIKSKFILPRLEDQIGCLRLCSESKIIMITKGDGVRNLFNLSIIYMDPVIFSR